MGNCFPSLKATLKGKQCQVEPVIPEDGESINASGILLTPSERALILDTWRRIDSDFTSRGMRIFKLVLLRPDIKALFPFANMPEEVMINDARYRAHACRFVQAVSAVIEELQANNDRLQTVANNNGKSNVNNDEVVNSVWKVGQLLQTLGQTHGKIQGLDADLYKEIGENVVMKAMIEVWKEDVGRYWSPEIEAAWTKLFRFIFRQVHEGLKSVSQKQRRSSWIGRRFSSQSTTSSSGSSAHYHHLRQSHAFTGLLRVIAALREGRKWQEKTLTHHHLEKGDQTV